MPRILLSLIFCFSMSSALAEPEIDCVKDGGQFIEGQCYCVRTRQVPSKQAEEKSLKGDKKCPALWGIELTFTNALLQRENVSLHMDPNQVEFEIGPKAERAAQDWLKEIDKVCKKRTQQNRQYKCVVNGNRVTYADGYYYVVNTDPGVVEIQGRPVSQNEWVKLSERIDRDIFKLAREAANVVPHRSAGSGHLHLDIASHFRGNFRLALDFLIDFQNHPYLSMCALGENFITNPPLAIQSQPQIDRFEETTRKWEPKPGEHLPEEVMKTGELESRLELLNKVFKSTFSDLNYSDKFQAVSLSHVHDFGSIEIRALRPEENANHVRLLMQLFEKRIAYLQAHPGQRYRKISLPKPQFAKKDILTNEPAIKSFYFDRPGFKESCVKEFYDYVLESDLPWDDYHSILYPELQSIVPSQLNPYKQIHHS